MNKDIIDALDTIEQVIINTGVENVKKGERLVKVSDSMDTIRKALSEKEVCPETKCRVCINADCRVIPINGCKFMPLYTFEE